MNARTGAMADPGPDGTRQQGLTRLADVQPERVEWLWTGRIPRGKLAVLDGDPALGKSTLCLAIAAQVSNGHPMPDGDHQLDRPANVLILSAEDGLADTIRPRADAAGADVARIHVLEWVPTTDDDGHATGQRPPSIPGDLEVIKQAVVDNGAVLLIVDVLSAFLSGRVDSYRDQDVRGALMPLSRLAEQTGCAVLVLRHLAKSGGPHALYRGGGSIGIIGAARAGLLVAPDPDDTERRIIAVTKSNLAAKPAALAYRLIDAPEHGCARVEWDGTTSHTADELLVTSDGPDSDGNDAAAALGVILGDGPLWAKQAIDAMADAGFSKDQAKRAKVKLRVDTKKFGKPGDSDSGWKWSLP